MNKFLALDVGGNPASWLNARSVIEMSSTGRILANMNDDLHVFHGGVNRQSGLRSEVAVSSILLTKERIIGNRFTRDFIPPFSKQVLVARDKTCLYCGKKDLPSMMTIDHILPSSCGGSNDWSNLALACSECNHKKGSRTPEEWGVLLKAVPYTPNWSEYLFLLNKKQVNSQQYEYLREGFSDDGPLRQNDEFKH